MPKATGVLDETRRLISGRLTELDEERRRIERALVHLRTKAADARPGRRAGGKAKATSADGGTRLRRKRGANRADQAVALVEKSPGSSASDIAKAMKIKPNYLYRVLGDLEKAGRIKKDGRKYYRRHNRQPTSSYSPGGWLATNPTWLCSA